MKTTANKNNPQNFTISSWFRLIVSTGKEKDEETGYGYFGARYMDHELMTSFISVDRYASKYPFISPYAYCAWNPIRITDPTGDSIRLDGTAEQRQRVLGYLHRFTHLTFQCDDNGYVTLNTEFPDSKIMGKTDEYIKKIIEDDINICVIKIQETGFVQELNLWMQPDNPTLFGGTSDYPKDGNWETGRVEETQYLNINLLGDRFGKDIKPYAGRIIMHEFSEAFEGCLLARDLKLPLLATPDDYSSAHSRANCHIWANFTPPDANGKSKLASIPHLEFAW